MEESARVLADTANASNKIFMYFLGLTKDIRTDASSRFGCNTRSVPGSYMVDIQSLADGNPENSRLDGMTLREH